MLTREQVLAEVESERIKSQCLDGRDFSRLVEFFPVSDWEKFGFELKEGAEQPVTKEWTEAGVKKELEEDVAFGFEKALNQRGISSSLMTEVVKMWLWVLEDPLLDSVEYAQYGLPMFKAVAVKYGFKNPIGEYRGDEYKYSVSY
jgi:hypothetical protein